MTSMYGGVSQIWTGRRLSIIAFLWPCHSRTAKDVNIYMAPANHEVFSCRIWRDVTSCPTRSQTDGFGTLCGHRRQSTVLITDLRSVSVTLHIYHRPWILISNLYRWLFMFFGGVLQSGVAQMRSFFLSSTLRYLWIQCNVPAGFEDYARNALNREDMWETVL